MDEAGLFQETFKDGRQWFSLTVLPAPTWRSAFLPNY